MIHSERILAIIPARGGSKGIVRKNLRKIGDRSLLEIAIETTQASRYIDRVVVSSEDHEIIQVAKQAGADVPFVRPEALAQDDTPGIDPILHAIGQLEHYDYVMLLQVTSPLRTTEDIDQCIAYCMTHNAPACVSVVEPSKHPFWMFTLDQHALVPLFPDQQYARRQDLPPVYVPNGAIYIAKTHWLRETKSFITPETIAFLMPQDRSIDIDSEYDLLLLNALGS